MWLGLRAFSGVCRSRFTVSDTSIPYANIGEFCSPCTPCLGDLACVRNRCQRPIAAHCPCDPDALFSVGCATGLTCYNVTRTCEPFNLLPGSACFDDSFCITGTCDPTTKTCAYLPENADCVSGYFTPLPRSFLCQAPNRCIFGACLPPRGQDAYCGFDSDVCAGDLVSNGTHCIPRFSLPLGARCHTSINCESKVCSFRGDLGSICVDPKLFNTKAEGDECVANLDCRFGLACVGSPVSSGSAFVNRTCEPIPVVPCSINDGSCPDNSFCPCFSDGAPTTELSRNCEPNSNFVMPRDPACQAELTALEARIGYYSAYLYGSFGLFVSSRSQIGLMPAADADLVAAYMCCVVSANGGDSSFPDRTLGDIQVYGIVSLNCEAQNSVGTRGKFEATTAEANTQAGFCSSARKVNQQSVVRGNVVFGERSAVGVLGSSLLVVMVLACLSAFVLLV